MDHDIIQPEGWAKPKGYANGILGKAGGRHLFVAGQIGWDGQCKFQSTEFLPQFEQALANVVAVVKAAGGQVEDITRLRIFVTDKRQYLADLRGLGAIWKATLGRHYPAMALVEVSALVEDDALLEIEADAII